MVATRLDIETPEDERYVPFAKSLLHKMGDYWSGLGIKSFTRHYKLGDTSIFIRGTPWGNYIRIRTGAVVYLRADNTLRDIARTTSFIGSPSEATGGSAVFFVEPNVSANWGIAMTAGKFTAQAASAGSGTVDLIQVTNSLSTWSARYEANLVDVPNIPDAWGCFMLSWSTPTTFRAYRNDTPIAASAIESGAGAKTADFSELFAGQQNITFRNDCIALLWLTPTYIDFSVEANRRLFVSATGRPVALGDNGELPLSTSPLIYHRGLYEFPLTNLGTGGDYTTISPDPLRCENRP